MAGLRASIRVERKRINKECNTVHNQGAGSEGKGDKNRE